MNSPAIPEQAAAEYLGLSVKTLQAWRWKRKGPAYMKYGRRVLYSYEDLDRYREAHKIEPEGGAR